MIAGPSPGNSLRCPKCSLALDPSVAVAADEVACPVCRSRMVVRLFPAFSAPPRTISSASGERASEGEAACFFHPEKRATVACERCGRFLCALCDIPLGGKHLCPSCLDTSKMPELVSRRLVWSHLAMILGVTPLILFCAWPIFIVTGPTAIFLALWKWKAPGSLVLGPRHGLSVVGIIGGLLQLLAVGGIVFGIYHSATHG